RAPLLGERLHAGLAHLLGPFLAAHARWATAAELVHRLLAPVQEAGGLLPGHACGLLGRRLLPHPLGRPETLLVFLRARVDAQHVPDRGPGEEPELAAAHDVSLRLGGRPRAVRTRRAGRPCHTASISL